MKAIEVRTPGYTYPVYTGINILPEAGKQLTRLFPTKQVAIITSKNIDQLYGDMIRESLNEVRTVNTLYVPNSETAKSFEQVQHLYTQLLESKFERNSVIVALGGGVVGDLAGFIAATYLRGIPLVQIPTTLLAQVDSSIGGKVGVNHPLGKNLIGAFKQPLFVMADARVLQTLPDEEIRCGLGEVVKYGFITNSSLFDYLDLYLDKALQKDEQVLNHMVQVSAAEKADVVSKDEKEQNLRMILNYGHTFGHALEADLKFGTLKHGEAVILGMKCALQYEKLSRNITDEEFRRGITLLNRIPVSYDKNKIVPDKLAERMLLDKKVKDGKIRLVLVNKIGSYHIESNASRDIIIEAFQILKDS